MNQEAKVTSFVVRFVYEEPHEEAAQIAQVQQAAQITQITQWYSVVRHVQSDTERHFTSWRDMVLFFEQYIDLSKGAKDE